jgi:RNA polymerase sigma factor (sigma-70 family)
MGVLFESAVGDDRAFERLYNSYAPNVFRYALAVLGQQADAEDITQTTFMNAYRALRRGERPTKPENWLIAIARNACIERFRHDRRRPREVALERELPVAAVQGGEATTATELQHALLQLPPTQRAALVMRELEGRSYAETAAALQISNSALETLLVRARRTLREQLEGEVSCGDALAAIEMQLDGRLPLSGRRVLRAHLRSCDDCATLARRLRAQKKTLRGLPTFWFPSFVGRFLAESGTGAGASANGGMGVAGIALKAAAMLAVGAAVGSGAYAGSTHLGPLGVHRGPASVVHGASSRSGSPSSPSNSRSAAAQRPSGKRPRGAVIEGAGLASQVVVPAAEPAAAPDQMQETGLASSGSTASGGVVTGESTRGPSTERAGSVGTARTASGKGVAANGIGKGVATNGNGKGVVANGGSKSRAAKRSTDPSSNTVMSAAGPSAMKVAPGEAKADANAGGGASSGASTSPSAQNSSSSAPSVPPGQGNVNANANGNASRGDTTGSGNANANPNANPNATAASAQGHG